MGQHTANVSKSIFDEKLRYAFKVVQQGCKWVDADDNDSNEALFRQSQRIVQHLLGDGYPAGLPDAFEIVEASSPSNNLKIEGGNGSVEGAARYWVGGLSCLLKDDVDYVNAGTDEAQKSIHPRNTGLTETILTDTAASYVVNELAGRTLIPDITTPGNSYTIASNTATTITVGGGDTMLVDGAIVGDRYRVQLSTPSGARTDGVYLNTYLDEIDSLEDPNLLHMVLGVQAEHTRRIQIVQSIFVREDTVAHGELTEYVDADGNLHHVVKLASLARTATANITNAMVTDLRTTAGIADRIVQVSDDDTVAGFLEDKTSGGANIVLSTLNPGGNEILQITATDEKTIVSADDTTPGDLEAKVVAGSGIVITTLDPGGNEQLQIASTSMAGSEVLLPTVLRIMDHAGTMASGATRSGTFNSGSSFHLDLTLSALLPAGIKGVILRIFCRGSSGDDVDAWLNFYAHNSSAAVPGAVRQPWHPHIFAAMRSGKIAQGGGEADLDYVSTVAQGLVACTPTPSIGFSGGASFINSLEWWLNVVGYLV